MLPACAVRSFHLGGPRRFEGTTEVPCGDRESKVSPPILTHELSLVGCRYEFRLVGLETF